MEMEHGHHQGAPGILRIVRRVYTRETQEEIGITITNVTFLAITNDVFEEQHNVTIWMAGKYVSGEPTMNAANEMSAAGWFSWNALPEPFFPPFEKLLTGQWMPLGFQWRREAGGVNNDFTKPFQR